MLLSLHFYTLGFPIFIRGIDYIINKKRTMPLHSSNLLLRTSSGANLHPTQMSLLVVTPSHVFVSLARDYHFHLYRHMFYLCICDLFLRMTQGVVVMGIPEST